MARSYGRFTTSIYRDEDFRALTLAQQGAYYLLGLQSDVTAVGVLSLALGRWASKADGLTRLDLETELRVLEDRGHIAIDDETEELLIVKFAKWDLGWANAKRRPVLMEAVKAIESVHIRDIAVDELWKIARDTASADDKAARDALSRDLEAVVCGSDRKRLVVTSGDQVPQPITASLEREPFDDVEPPPMFCDEHMPNGTTKACGPCGTRRRAFDAWHERDAQRQVAAENERRAAIRNCDACNDQGLVEDHAGQLVARCNHAVEVSVA